MKQNLTKMMLLGGAFLGVSLQGEAVQPMEYVFSDDAPRMIRQGEPFNCQILPYKRSELNKNRATRAEGGNTVTLNYDYDSELFMADMMVSIDWEGGSAMEFLMPGETKLVFEGIPSTEILVRAGFRNLGVPHKPGSYYIFKEMTIDGDTSVDIKPDDASMLIKFSSVMPDGSAPTLPVISSREDEDAEKDFTNANCTNIGAYTLIASKKWGGLIVSGANKMETTLDGLSGPEDFWVQITPVDDTWHFSQTRWVEDMDRNMYLSHTACVGGQEPKINAPEFVKFDCQFAENPILDLIESTGTSPEGYTVQYMINGCVDAHNWQFFSPQRYNYYLSKPMTADTSWRTTNYGIQVMNVEYDVDIITSWGSMPDIRCVYSPIGIFNDTDNSVTVLNNSTINGGSPLWWNEKYGDPVVLPTTEALCLPSSEVKYPYGSTAPVCVSTILDRGEDGEMDLQPSVTYLGVYGDIRNADDALSEAFVKCGDVDENCNLDKLEKLLRNLSMEESLSGKMEIEIANDRNIKFQGIEGYNIATLTVADVKGSDINPPTLTAYQLRNTDGEVAVEFDAPEDAVIYLTGGDFYPAGDEYDPWFGVQLPSAIKVEAAPEESDLFTEIPVEVIEDNFCMPNMGYFWQGSLKDIPTPAADTWYKVRVTLTDKAGNVQEQTIYPLFKLNGDSAVETISADNNSPVSFFNLQGMKISNPEARQLVIRQQNGKTSKIIVR